ncbi:MAG TPA: ABC transporter ATP-binding protein [Intrasporangiaceae bacterium]|nr:ABC transporter ATP-binding protein [Intrasporangiaceae bacterium]
MNEHGTSESVVEFDDVSKAYGQVKALNRLTLQVRAGRVTALLGPNGAGKTTLMEIMTGIRQADSGRVRVLGMDPARHRRQLAARLGVQVQEFNLQSTVRVREALTFFASLYNDPENVDELIDRFGLVAKADANFPTLSGG